MTSSTITDIYNSSKRFVWVIIITLILLIVIPAIYDHFSHPVPTNHQNTEVLDRQVDSLRIRAARLQFKLDSTNARLYADSIRYTTAEIKLIHVPQMLQQIKNRYDIKIHTIDTLSDDEQSSLFSDWITQTDSL